MAGAPKLGKSWMALGLGVAIASGGRAFGTVPVVVAMSCTWHWRIPHDDFSPDSERSWGTIRHRSDSTWRPSGRDLTRAAPRSSTDGSTGTLMRGSCLSMFGPESAPARQGVRSHPDEYIQACAEITWGGSPRGEGPVPCASSPPATCGGIAVTGGRPATFGRACSSSTLLRLDCRARRAARAPGGALIMRRDLSYRAASRIIPTSSARSGGCGYIVTADHLTDVFERHAGGC